MTPHQPAGSHLPAPETQRDQPQAALPASTAELAQRAWTVVADADRPITAAELAALAGITRGAAARFLAEWTRAGRLTAGACIPGRSTPYQIPYDRPGAAVRVLVTGSRDWADTDTLTAALTELRATHGPRLVIVHGGCPRGADQLADQWCRATGTPAERWPADWTTHGRAAGVRRNLAMVASRPAACLAFLAGDTPGTTHCANAAERAGIPTTRYRASLPARRPVEAPTLLAAALAAAARGWHVFPLRPDAKRPAFPDHAADRCTGTDPWCHNGHTGWEKRATTDPDRIRRAWSTRPYGIGVACGPSGLLVVDLDQPKPGATPPPDWPGARSGTDVLALLARRAGRSIPATYTVHTGRGGTHLYFTRPAGARLGNSAGGIGWLVDTRATGGYVVAAGSTVAGRPYTVADDRPPAPLPDWLLTRLTTPVPAPASTPPAVERVSAYLRAAVAGEVAHVAAATEGSRNRTLFTAAAVLGQLVTGAGLPAELVTAELEQAAAGIGLGPAEAAATIRSGLRAGARRPRQLGRPAPDHGQAA
jgi:hypothetical protein